MMILTEEKKFEQNEKKMKYLHLRLNFQQIYQLSTFLQFFGRYFFQFFLENIQATIFFFVKRIILEKESAHIS